jgi:hypothetical protein
VGVVRFAEVTFTASAILLGWGGRYASIARCACFFLRTPPDHLEPNEQAGYMTATEF